ncbi:hypothetical protein MUN53_05075 [Parabacteroides sp. AGMB00274]|uniref:Uncharacterized protein n=1 Tax=Parabacteroides faecalis TaxID=2924040 RepID=A0ABT0BYZ8_9BACT|nr:hypothetical protein [Parabacteroides faecalis]MCJ2379987.1 hypothetical protein [Parabacteroides faecalis]
MVTIEDLIKEGESFEIKYSEPYIEYRDGMNILHEASYYIEDGQKFFGWVEKSKRFIQINFPKDIALARFNELSNKKISKETIYNLIAILISLRDIPGCCPKEKATPKTYINISQTQEQTQEIHTIHNILRETLTQEQYNELKNLARETNNNADLLKPKIIEKIKDFGESVMSNIIASLLTNPSIWNNL